MGNVLFSSFPGAAFDLDEKSAEGISHQFATRIVPCTISGLRHPDKKEEKHMNIMAYGINTRHSLTSRDY